MRRAALIYNPKSGRQRHARRLAEILDRLRQGGFDAEPVPTAGPDDATRLARELARADDPAENCEVVFAYGGDGTVREVAAGLLGTPTALGILPGGTVNLLAHALGLPKDPVDAADLLPRLPARWMDVGLAGDVPFLMMVSAGLDAAVLAALDPRLKLRFGQGAFVGQGLREWWRYGYPRLELEADGEPFEASFVAVSNIPFYGGAFRLAPGARLDDGRLDLVLLRDAGRLRTLRFAFEVLRGAHVHSRDVIARPVREVVLRAPAGAAAQVDGDLCRQRLPVNVRLARERLAVLAPEPLQP